MNHVRIATVGVSAALLVASLAACGTQKPTPEALGDLSGEPSTIAIPDNDLPAAADEDTTAAGDDTATVPVSIVLPDGRTVTVGGEADAQPPAFTSAVPVDAASYDNFLATYLQAADTAGQSLTGQPRAVQVAMMTYAAWGAHITRATGEPLYLPYVTLAGQRSLDRLAQAPVTTAKKLAAGKASAASGWSARGVCGTALDDTVTLAKSGCVFLPTLVDATVTDVTIEKVSAQRVSLTVEMGLYDRDGLADPAGEPVAVLRTASTWLVVPDSSRQATLLVDGVDAGTYRMDIVASGTR